MSAPAQKSAAEKVRAQFFGWATRIQVAVLIRKTNNAIGVRDIKKFRIRPRRIKRDSERLVQIFVGEKRRLPICTMNHFDLVNAALANKNLAVRRRQ